MRTILLIHPAAFKKMKAVLTALAPPQVAALRGFNPLFGLEYRIDPSALVWKPPKDRFIEYEEKDYGWLRALGYGSMEPGMLEMRLPDFLEGIW